METRGARMHRRAGLTVGACAHDSRIRAWDVWNEPDNHGPREYAAYEAENKIEKVAVLLP